MQTAKRQYLRCSCNEPWCLAHPNESCSARAVSADDNGASCFQCKRNKQVVRTAHQYRDATANKKIGKGRQKRDGETRCRPTHQYTH